MIKVKNIIPREELSRYIKKIAVFESKEKISYKHKLTPSAYTYLSYNHKDIPISHFGNKRIQPTGRIQIAGPKVNEKIYVEYNGTLSQILIEFTATGFYYLFHHSPSLLKNKLTEINRFILPDVHHQLEKKLSRLKKVEKQVEVLEEFLIEKSFKAIPPLDYLEKGLTFIDEQFGNIKINQLDNITGIGKRQFHRKFLEVVGVTPKYYSKITQLNYVINMMCSKNYLSIKDLAYQAEFYDFPHFAHRFKELTGFTPHEFIHSEQHIAMKYFTDKTNNNSSI